MDFFVFFLKKEEKPVYLKKNKKQVGCFFFKTGFSQPDCLSILFVISLDRTIWNKSRHYQFHWMCAVYLEYRSLILKNVRITGISIRKN